MSSKLTADEIVQMQHVRGFLQFGEPGPENELEYYGKSGQYFFVESLSAPESGSINPIQMPDPSRRRAWRLVGREYTPPDLSTYNLILYEKHGRVPRALGRIGCEFNLFLSVGRCKEPSNFDTGWQDYLHVLEGGVVSDKDHGNRTSQTDDTPATSTLTVTLADEYAVGPLSFGPQAATNVATEVIDGTYGLPDACDGCNNGIDRRYLLVKADGGSPAAAPKVVYKTEYADWTDLAITGIGVAATVSAIEFMGNYLIVLSPSEDAYYYTEVNDVTGVPGPTWVKVTAGFVGAGTPNDIYVLSPAEAIIVGDAGYIYRLTSLGSEVQLVDAGSATSDNLNRVDGVDEVVVAVGANGACIQSTNGGLSFAPVTTGLADDVTALEVVTATRYWIGTDAGEVWESKTSGQIWVERTFGVTLAAVHDIVFVTRSVGFIAATTAGPQAIVFATQNGGRTWHSGGSRLPNLRTIVHDRYNRIIVPMTDASQTNVNNVMLVGLDGGGTDGIALSAQAEEL
jgi:hypothetical protein